MSKKQCIQNLIDNTSSSTISKYWTVSAAFWLRGSVIFSQLSYTLLFVIIHIFYKSICTFLKWFITSFLIFKLSYILIFKHFWFYQSICRTGFTDLCNISLEEIVCTSPDQHYWLIPEACNVKIMYSRWQYPQNMYLKEPYNSQILSGFILKCFFHLQNILPLKEKATAFIFEITLSLFYALQISVYQGSKWDILFSVATKPIKYSWPISDLR